jgi:hypothetical protein
MNGDTDYGATHNGQIECGSAVAHPAAILSGNHVQTEVQAAFDAPIPTVSPKHLLSAHLSGWAGSEEVFGFNALGGLALAVDATGQAGGLLHKRETDGGGGGVESNDTARLGAAAVQFTGLGDGPLGQRGKTRARGFGGAVARCRQHPADCLWR